MIKKNISKAVRRRLPRYYRYLEDILSTGQNRISSEELSRKMGLTASQVRQDFNQFGGFGHQGYGYQVEYLKNEIGKILGINKEHRIVIVGAGNLGSALMKSKDFANHNFAIKAIFDIDKKIIGKKICDITVSDIADLGDVIKNNEIDIVAITVPKSHAKEIIDKVIACGVKAIWNFADFDLELPKDVIVENVHLVDSLMQLSYSLTDSNN